ncbi:hypothetical protein V6N13_048665 [Hibiscus sabdariffa]
MASPFAVVREEFVCNTGEDEMLKTLECRVPVGIFFAVEHALVDAPADAIEGARESAMEVVDHLLHVMFSSLGGGSRNCRMVTSRIYLEEAF